MGTEIIDKNNVYVKRYSGGKAGVMFGLKINKQMTQKEFSRFLAQCTVNLIVDGEGK